MSFLQYLLSLYEPVRPLRLVDGAVLAVLSFRLVTKGDWAIAVKGPTQTLENRNLNGLCLMRFDRLHL